MWYVAGKKIVFIMQLLSGFKFLSIFYNKQWRKAVNKIIVKVRFIHA